MSISFSCMGLKLCRSWFRHSEQWCVQLLATLCVFVILLRDLRPTSTERVVKPAVERDFLSVKLSLPLALPFCHVQRRASRVVINKQSIVHFPIKLPPLARWLNGLVTNGYFKG